MPNELKTPGIWQSEGYPLNITLNKFPTDVTITGFVEKQSEAGIVRFSIIGILKDKAGEVNVGLIEMSQEYYEKNFFKPGFESGFEAGQESLIEDVAMPQPVEEKK